MISKTYRLTKGEIDGVKKQGRSLRSDCFTLVYTRDPNIKQGFAIIVSKKISLKAVIRNKLKRSIFNVIRVNDLTNGLKISCLIIPRPIFLIDSEKNLRQLMNSLQEIC